LSEIKQLGIAKTNYIQLSRIGYPDEGLRLTIFDNVPFNCSFEVQLSKSDIKWLIAKLTEALEKENNIPK
jgi:hypothetical protein